MKLLHLIGTLDPAYGGPVEGLLQSVRVLNEIGHANEIVTLDQAKAPWLVGNLVPVHALGPAYGKYNFTPRLLPWLRENASNYDALIVQGIWQYHGLAAWLATRGIATPYHVFVHGALDPWFRNTYPLKHLKKWVYWLLAEYHILQNAHLVLFTSEEEKRLARQSFDLYNICEKVVSYGIAAPTGNAEEQQSAFLQAFPELKGRKIILYLGRIDWKKGCDLLLRAFSSLAAQYPEWTLVMAGPDPSSLRATLEKYADSPNIIWTGLLTGDQKWGALHAAKVFILPSHSENFGVAVVEALACGKPVLISNKVNIWQEIEQAGAGLIAPDTLLGTQALLERWFFLGEEGQHDLTANAIPCFQKNFEIRTSALKFIESIQS